MKSLYDKNEKYTEDARLLSLQMSEILKPVFKKYSDKGYTYAEISHLIIGEVFSVECLQRLKKVVDNHKKSKSG